MSMIESTFAALTRSNKTSHALSISAKSLRATEQRVMFMLRTRIMPFRYAEQGPIAHGQWHNSIVK